MQNPRFQEISELFARAAQLTGDERAEFLSAACGEDGALRREVESLLEHDDADDSLPTGLFDRLHDEPEDAPERIGPYVVEETLGRGGMGVVFRARQEAPIRREVAIKLLRRELQSDLFLARFESEKQALAAMSHPNVAGVYDAGLTEDGRPYFAMELVRGESIIEYCDSRQLGLDERVALFRQVCSGVQHAHQKGIIHRDLKPSNILVTTDSGAPTPKIIDFGVAKTLDRALAPGDRATGAWMLLGTPEYMSPEQALLRPGQTDTRSDVYSLGVILYELLTGRLPIDPDTLRGESVYQMCRAIREDVPPRPSARVSAAPEGADGRLPGGTSRARLARRLREDLDWITMKALEKSPAERYATPMDLAVDLRRHFAFEPVAARPPSAFYRVRRFVRKRLAAVAVSGVVVLAVSTLLVLATVQSVRAEREAARAEREARKATDTAELLIGLFGTSPPYYERGGQQTIRQSLEAAVESSREELADRPVMLARLLFAVGEAHRREGRIHQAGLLLEEANGLLTRELGRDDPETQRTTESLARMALYSGREEEAERMLTEVLENRRARYGKRDARTLEAMIGVGVVHRETGRDEEAVTLLERASEGLAGLGPEYEVAKLVAENHLASTYMDLGRYGDARELLERIVERLPVRVGVVRSETIIARYNLGCVLANLGETEAGLKFLREAISNGFKYPGSMWQDPHVAVLYDHPEFETLERRSRLNGANRDLPVTRAAVLIATGREDAAERLLDDLLYSIGAEHRPREVAHALVPFELKTVLLLRQRRYEEAARTARDWAGLIDENPYLEDRRMIDPLLFLAEALAGLVDREAAIEEADRASAIAWRPGQRAYARAVRSAVGGDDAQALEALGRAASLGVDMADHVRRSATFAPLRSRSGYAGMIARMERNAL